MTTNASPTAADQHAPPSWLWGLFVCGLIAAAIGVLTVALVSVMRSEDARLGHDGTHLALAGLAQDAGVSRSTADLRLDSILPIVADAYGVSRDVAATQSLTCTARLHRAGVIQDPVQMLEGVSSIAPVQREPGMLAGVLAAYSESRIRGLDHRQSIDLAALAMRTQTRATN